MSAIYGQVSWKDNINIDNGSLMKTVYEKKCKIDAYNEIFRRKIFFGCGLQYIQNKQFSEKMPLMISSDNSDSFIAIVADCIIDNRQDICEKYLETDVNEISDSELIYRLYSKFDLDFIGKLRGLFAIAIYDSSMKRLFLAVDQVSSRSLYYYIDKEKGTITFSTLIEPITALYNNEKDVIYIKDYLLAPGLKPNIEAGRTGYSNIKQVLPARAMCFEFKDNMFEIKENKYFEYLPLEGISYANADKVGKQFRKLYEECVSTAINVDGEVAVSMSSGLDSASIATIAAVELGKKGRKLFTYTYVPEKKPERTRIKNIIFDEREDVEKILAMHSNMESSFLCNNGMNCYKYLEQDLSVMEIPIKAYVNFPNLFEIYDKAKADGCKVVLTGQTGNGSVSFGYIDDVLFDLFENRKYFSMFDYLNRYSKKVKESRKESFKACVGLYRDSKKRKQNDRIEISNYTPTNMFLSDKILEDYPLAARFYEAGMKYFKYIPTDSSDYKRLFFSDELFAYIGAMETKMGLYSGLLIRDATKDIRLLRFCYYLPFKYFAYKGTPRWLIRNNLRDYIPNEILDDWMRYGIQNMDCFERISRDWNEVSKKAKVIIDGCMSNMETYSQYINLEELRLFFEQSCENSKEWEIRFDYASFSLMILLFYQIC